MPPKSRERAPSQTEGDAREVVLDFVLSRMTAQLRHLRPRCYGISSNALTLYALGKAPRPQTPGWSDSERGGSWRGDECGQDYPWDEDDLRACELTYAMAPKHLQARMLPVLEEFERWVRHGLNRYGAPHPYRASQPQAERASGGSDAA